MKNKKSDLKTGEERGLCIIQTKVNRKLTMKHTAIDYETYGN